MPKIKSSRERDVYLRRSSIPTMAQYPPISLLTADATNLTAPELATFTASNKDLGLAEGDPVGINIGPYELLPFLCNETSYIGERESNESSIVYEDIGLSTVAVQTGDEMWQFPGTLFAFAVRKSNQSRMTIVGRARMLSPMGLDGKIKIAELPYDNQDPFENRAHDESTRRSFSLTYRQLFTLTLITAFPTIWH